MNDIMIKTERLTKTYRRYRKKEGVLGSIASLWKRDYEERIAVTFASPVVNLDIKTPTAVLMENTPYKKYIRCQNSLQIFCSRNLWGIGRKI